MSSGGLADPVVSLRVPNVHIDTKKASVDEVKTTPSGYRLSTFLGGSLTGRGADLIVIPPIIGLQFDLFE